MNRDQAEKPGAIWVVSPVWGRSYCQFFTDYCVPSLMTDIDLAALSEHPSAFVIYTLEDDAAFIRAQPSIQALSRRLDVRYVTFDRESVGGGANGSYRLMTRCHQDVLERGAPHNAGYFFIQPDTVCSKGSLKRCLDLAAQGYRAVMLPGLRAVRETLCREIEPFRENGPGSPLHLHSRTLVSSYLDDLLPASKACFHEGLGNHIESMHLWRIKDLGFLARCYHLHPYFLWPEHETFRIYSTLDLDMVRRALRHPDRIYIVTDSDEISCVEGSDDERFEKPLSVFGRTPEEMADWALYNTNVLHRQFANVNIVFRTRDGEVPPEIIQEADRVIQSHTLTMREIYGDQMPEAVLAEQLEEQKALYADMIRAEKAGRYGLVWRIANQLEDIFAITPTVEEWLRVLQHHNIWLKLSQYVFAFEWIVEIAAKDEKLLSEMETVLSDQNIRVLAEGRLKATRKLYGRCMAFLAPHRPDLFPLAEKFLEQTNERTANLEAILSLFHLYLDWKKPERAAEMLAKADKIFPMFETMKVKNSISQTLLPTVLAARLKGALHLGLSFSREEWDALSSLDLSVLFGWTKSPYDCIMAGGYLARLAYERTKDYDLADTYFQRVQRLPLSDTPVIFPEQHVLLAQVMVWNAMIAADSGRQDQVARLMGHVLYTFEKIGQQAELQPMLALDGWEPRGGWFAPAWKALTSWDWSESFSREACDRILDCFTFCYH